MNGELALAGATLLGFGVLVLWFQAMFTDGEIGKLFIYLCSDVRNGIAFLFPAGGVGFVVLGVSLLSEPYFPEAYTVRLVAVPGSLLLILTAVIVHVFPVRLPRWMYPEWHAQRRLARRRAALGVAAETGLGAGGRPGVRADSPPGCPGAGHGGQLWSAGYHVAQQPQVAGRWRGGAWQSREPDSRVASRDGEGAPLPRGPAASAPAPLGPPAPGAWPGATAPGVPTAPTPELPD